MSVICDIARSILRGVRCATEMRKDRGIGELCRKESWCIIVVENFVWPKWRLSDEDRLFSDYIFSADIIESRTRSMSASTLPILFNPPSLS
jgi:hypothetical protein